MNVTKAIRSLAWLLAVLSVLTLVACDTQEAPTPEETTLADTTVEEETTTEEETTAPVDPANDGNLRVILASDLHYTYLETYFVLSADDRMQHFVDSILLEHQKQPIDLLIIAGDTSLDHWFTYGSYTKDKISTSKSLCEKYFSQITAAGIPMFVLAGNHEQFNNEQWKEITGNERYGAIAMEGNLFILLDAFSVDLEPNYDNDPSYGQHDVAYIKQQMELHPECQNVYLVSHYFNYNNESTEFKMLVRTDKRIKGLFQGHTHTNKIINMGSAYADKIIAETGHFSHYTGSDALEKNFWGFRELIITPQTAITRYITVQTKLVFGGTLFIDLKRTTQNAARLY